LTNSNRSGVAPRCCGALNAHSGDREGAQQPFLADLDQRLCSLRDRAVQRAAAPAVRATAELRERIERTLVLDGAEFELRLQPLAERMLHLHAVSLLLEEADWQAAEGSYRTLLLACEYLRQHVMSVANEGSLGLAAIERFEDLADWAALPDSSVAAAIIEL